MQSTSLLFFAGTSRSAHAAISWDSERAMIRRNVTIWRFALVCACAGFDVLTDAAPQTPPALAAQPVGEHLIEQAPAVTGAEQLWVRMLAAKGGEKRLRDVRSFAIAIRAPAGAAIGQEIVVQLPDKTWRWNDLRPNIDMFGVDVWDLSQHKDWHAARGASTAASQWSSGLALHNRGFLAEWQLAYFGATTFLRPKPVRILHSKDVRNQLTVLELDVDGLASVRDAIDLDTGLPMLRMKHSHVSDSRSVAHEALTFSRSSA
jgi:hypothetical protein